jgi:hypothetical protein
MYTKRFNKFMLEADALRINTVVYDPDKDQYTVSYMDNDTDKVRIKKVKGYFLTNLFLKINSYKTRKETVKR